MRGKIGLSSWGSARFAKKVHLTYHAVDRVARRGLSEGLIRELIETGNVKQKDLLAQKLVGFL